MHFFQHFLHLVMHLDEHIQHWVQVLGPWVYTLVFFIILCETGLIVAPFLPGDSLIFALGALTTGEAPALDFTLLCFLLSSAAIIGGIMNYALGTFIGPRVFQKEKSFWFKKAHLNQTQSFYKKHGGKAVVLARFLPIVRTFVPFVAGIGRMNYTRFTLFNTLGGFSWVLLLLTAGHFFGNIPAVKRNFGVVIPLIIVVSALPLVLKVGSSVKARQSKKKLQKRSS